MKEPSTKGTGCLISVVICTHNRMKCLSDAIQSVCDQDFPSPKFEIIIVDNASTDDTSLLVKGYCEKYTNIRYTMEPKIGLSYARNRGWQEAYGTYVAYLDDDAKASPQWLRSAERAIGEQFPALLGGPYMAFFNEPKPKWFKDTYGTRSLGDKPMRLERGFLSGNNLFVRRDVFTLIGGFSPELGMSGDRIAYAEEVHFQHRLREAYPGETIYYDPDILIFHLVRLEKHTLWWRLSSSFASGRDYYRSKTKDTLRLSSAISDTAKLIFELFNVSIRFLWRDREQYPFWQNYIYERVRLTVGRAGKVFALWQHYFQVARE